MRFKSFCGFKGCSSSLLKRCLGGHDICMAGCRIEERHPALSIAHDSGLGIQTQLATPLPRYRDKVVKEPMSGDARFIPGGVGV